MNIALMCFGIASIASISGAEKVFVEMANAMSARGHRVYAVWNDAPGVVPHYPQAAEVQQCNLGLGKIKVPFLHKVHRELGKTLKLKRLNKVDVLKTQRLAEAVRTHLPLDEIDAFVCFEFNSVMVANRLAGGRKAVLAMVHNSVADQIGKLTAAQRQEADKADVYQVLLPGFAKQAKQFLNTEIVCIPNAVPQAAEADCADLANRNAPFTVVTVGRVEPNQKQTLKLIQAFGKIAPENPDWRLHYYGPIGDAAYKERIDRYVAEHGLANQIEYKGTSDNVFSVLQKADIFAFPSAYEGFSLALTEAMTVGLPVVGFAAADSVNELIQHQINGLLANDDDNFAEQLSVLMRSQTLRAEMGKAAHEAMKAYRPEGVWQQWEDLIERVCTKYA